MQYLLNTKFFPMGAKMHKFFVHFSDYQNYARLNTVIFQK